MGPVRVGGDQQHRRLSHLQRLAVQRPHKVGHLHGLALVLPCAHRGQQQLLAPVSPVGNLVRLGVVGQNIRNHAPLIFGVILAPALGRLPAHRRRPHSEKQHHCRRQDQAAQPVFAPPVPCLRSCVFSLDFLHRSDLRVFFFSIAISPPNVKETADKVTGLAITAPRETREGHPSPLKRRAPANEFGYF